ncbi:reverse transcriptase domain-containing protein [Tanacetum coccineum]
MEARYGKFLDMIRAVRINVPLVNVLAGMPNYGKFLKELVSNKHKIEQISAAFLSDKSSVILQNKVPPKLGDPESFLIPCNINKAFSCNALADLGASINLMPYYLYAKLSLETLKPAKMGQLNLGVGTERMIFHINSAMKHSYSNDDTCFSIDVIDKILEEDFDSLLDEGSRGTILEKKLFAEFDEFMAMTTDENSESKSDTEEPPFEKITFNTYYKIKTSLEEPPTDLKLKPLPDNLEDAFLEEPSFLPVIISSQLLSKGCKDAHLVLNWEKCHFMVKEGIVLGHKVSEAGLEFDKARIDVISKLPPPLISKLLEKDTPFEFDDECHNAFKMLKEKLTCAPVIVILNWNLPFELMYDASDFAVGSILDRKSTEHVVADHLSQIKNDETSDDSEVDDNFP